MRFFKWFKRVGPVEPPGMRELVAQTRLNGEEIDKMSAAIISQARQLGAQHDHLVSLTRGVERVAASIKIPVPDIDINSISAFRRLEVAIQCLTEAATKARAKPPPKRPRAPKARRPRKRKP